MRFDWRLAVLVVCSCGLACVDFHRGPVLRDAGSDAGGPADPTFETAVYPILESRCQGCHAAGRMAGYSNLVLTGYAPMDRAMVAALVVPGDPTASLLLLRATGESHPPGEVLDPESTDYHTIAKWISNLPAGP
jgi:hypothetical protein